MYLILIDNRVISSHLKERFGEGYQIEIRLTGEDRLDECMQILKGICEDIEIEEKHGQFIRLKVPVLDLGYAFRILEENKGGVPMRGTGVKGREGSLEVDMCVLFIYLQTGPERIWRG